MAMQRRIGEPGDRLGGSAARSHPSGCAAETPEAALTACEAVESNVQISLDPRLGGVMAGASGGSARRDPAGSGLDATDEISTHPHEG